MRADAPDAIRTEGLSKRFGRTIAVDGLSLAVRPGEVFGFLGPNGAGKSTTIRLLLGLLRPTAGRAWLFGEDAADVCTAHCHVAYVPADVTLWPHLTGAETLELLARIGPGTDRSYQAELIDRFDLDPHRRGRTYSTGNRQKVALVAAFSTRARLLILDEPASGLDPLMERAFRGCIAEAAARGQTVLLSSHQLAEVEAVCERVGILRQGRLVEVAGLADLRRLRRTEVDVTLATTFDTGGLDGLARAPGVGDLRRPEPNRVVLALTGPPGPALRALAALEVVRLDVREASLEEIFLDYYGDPDGDRDAGPPAPRAGEGAS